jgi:hypothetical protein
LTLRKSCHNYKMQSCISCSRCLVKIEQSHQMPRSSRLPRMRHSLYAFPETVIPWDNVALSGFEPPFLGNFRRASH